MSFHIAICTDGIYPESTGGMQKHSRMLVDELSRYRDLIITVIHPHHLKIFADSVNEIRVDPIDPRRNYLLECYRYSKRVYKELVRISPDVIYSQGLSVWYRAEEFRPKLIINPHGLEAYQTTGLRFKLITLPMRLVFNRLFTKPAIVVSLGGKLTNILKQKLGRGTRLVEIPNAGTTPGTIAPVLADNHKIKCLFLARLVANKGINVLFQAIDKLKRANQLHRFEFTIAGTGPLYKHYLEKNKYPEVRLIGYVPDDNMASLYRSHDLFVLPTLFEGMPTVVIEAMSFGLPVIVSDVGATSVLVDDSNGRLIRPGSAEELFEALQWFAGLNNAQLVLVKKNALKKFNEEFTWTRIADAHVQLFRSVVARAKSIETV